MRSDSGGTEAMNQDLGGGPPPGRRLATLGILGGMGALASAAFLNTVYRLHLTALEQEAPRCILLSDPTFPDRTEAILSGAAQPVTGRLAQALETLYAAGAERIVLACVTLHHFLSGVAAPLRRGVIPLPDLAMARIAATPGRHLLLASSGTRAARIFESHPLWPQVAARVALPEAGDQEELHRRLYRLKADAAGGEAGHCIGWLRELRDKYQAAGLVLACTELHLLHPSPGAAPPLAAALGAALIDPLLIAAETLPVSLAGGRPAAPRPGPLPAGRMAATAAGGAPADASPPAGSPW
jgi:aspartate racemase